MANIALTGTQVFGVRRLTASAMEYSAETQMKGQKYHRYRYNGVVFIVNENDPFVEDKANGKVNEIHLIETEEIEGDNKVTRYTLDYYVTNQEKMGVAKFDAELKALEHFTLQGKLSAEEVADLESLA